MVVENDPADLGLMCAALRADGYSILPATGYLTGINTFGMHMNEIELLITAVALPEKNGCELVKGLRAIDPDLKVLFVSGTAGAEICRFYDFPGVGVYFLEKPLERLDFMRMVRQILEPGVPIRTMGAG
jgi:CheY-like chemotaxis protein